MHAASVGESRLLLALFAALRESRPELAAVITTQTLTSARLIDAAAAPGVTHQMAPVDTPSAVRRFLAHWRPDAAIFAEGEIWPNMLLGLRRNGIAASLVNARMTARTLTGWNTRDAFARQVFSAFRFIGAADKTTADGLARALRNPVDIIGNLKEAVQIIPPPESAVREWRAQIGARTVLLAASTHPGEDEIALDAFIAVRKKHHYALLVITPRHPDRGESIAASVRARGLTCTQRSREPAPPAADCDVLVADTMGELLFWYAACDAVYLGGAHAQDVGGHNPVEPLMLGKRVYSGPNGFNFTDMFQRLEQAGVLVIGSADGLARYWLDELARADARMPDAASLFANARAAFTETCASILTMIPGSPPDA